MPEDEYTYTIETEDDDSPNLYKQAANEADNKYGEEVIAVRNLLTSQLKGKGEFDGASECADAGHALAAIARQHGKGAHLAGKIDKVAGKVAGDSSYNGQKDGVLGGIEAPVVEVAREQEEQELEDLAGNGHAYTLDRGVGLDEYVEGHLVRVVKLSNTDYVSDYTYEFEFDDGTSVEFEDNDHRNPNEFYDQISVAAPVRVRDRFASNKAREDISGDTSEDDWAEEKYRELSLGPEERPWGLDWNEVITHLEHAEGEDMAEPPAGPRTDAWESLQRSIKNGRAAHDRQSVIDAADGAVHYNENHDEVWVPTSMVDAACEDYATNREKLVRELDARGVTTDEISGVGCSQSQDGVRWWRLKASAVEMPRIVQSIDEADTFASAGKAAADGGTTEFGGDE
ncbi:hypothetical protein C478_07472 [Natrinema thermotolerans DSM 11552]|nr:hypothetical protein C478_07472 [Natrinema thermotolerans DSM 11552]